MKIGIIGAMAQEIEILLSMLEEKTEIQIASSRIYQGKIQGVDIALLQSGIGKVAATVGTTLLLQHSKPDVILNTGSAGGTNSNLQVGDIVLSTEVRHHDVDVTAFGYEYGQLPAYPAAFKADSRLLNLAQQVAAQQNLNVHTGLICSGDRFIHNAAQLATIKQHFPSIIALEMESAAIAQVCYAFNIPFLVVRAISDNGDDNASMSFEEFLPIAAQRSSALVLAMLPLL